MGKLVKYCSSCEEGFAERFGFCPNCGGGLEAFEMNPVAKSSETVAETNENNFVQNETSVPAAALISAESKTSIPETLDFSGDDILELDEVDTRETVIEKEPETLAATAPAFSPVAINSYSDNIVESATVPKYEANGDYHVTVVSESASSWFKPFLYGLMAFTFVAALAAYAIAIMTHNLVLPPIDIAESSYLLNEDTPLDIEEEVKKNDEEGGGGGGGGNENPNPASKGRIPTTSDKPTELTIVDRMNSDLVVQNRVQSNIVRQDDNQPVGGGTSDVRSSGSGTGRGIGTGVGTGIGTGVGTGVGSGRGSGTGDGIGNGNGDGIGDGDQRNTPPVVAKVEPKPVGETKGVTITSKPQARYTDAARQNNVQGTVTLRVTFLANGTIGGVSPVNSLPNGLTEQAISAAKQIKFQPAMRNGQPYAVTKQVVYSFTIY